VRFKLFGIALLVGLVLVPVSASAQVLYATQACGSCDPYPDGLYTLNPADGTPTLIGNTGESITGLDVHPITGVLYGTTTPNSANPSSLVTINTTTAAVTVVGPHGLDMAMSDLTFAPDGTLYGWLEPSGDVVVRIDLGTGAATLVGESGLNTGGSAFDLAPDGFFYLFGACCGISDQPDHVTKLEVASGISLEDWPLNNLDNGRFPGASFNGSGVLYAVMGPQQANDVRQLVTVDLAAGSYTVVGRTADYLSGLAWSTTPAIVWPAPQVTPIPVLNRTGLIVLGVLVAVVGVVLVRRYVL
jgi:hypothetical protein